MPVTVNVHPAADVDSASRVRQALSERGCHLHCRDRGIGLGGARELLQARKLSGGVLRVASCVERCCCTAQQQLCLPCEQRL